ncbi:MAG: TonB-dependent receptor plug domain-containing protein, partial [Flavitalea sp.]
MFLGKIVLLCTILLLGGFSLVAQNRTIIGRVLDEKDNPVSNASVTIKGSSQGTTTNEEGQFSLNAPASATITVSSINFNTVEWNVSGNNAPLIHLKPSDKALSEVVVVAYGTQKRSEITSSISTVSTETIKNQQITSVGQALQGTAPGVQVVNNNGQPGENPVVRIRGIASILASAAPLIVVDGIVFDGNLNMINPNDIDNFSILKDATASALYGSRAANGVILLNTKLGKRNGIPTITLNSLYGVSSRAIKDYAYLNTKQHFELGWEALKNYFEGEVNPEQIATDNLVDQGFRYNPYGPNFSSPVGTDGKLIAGAVPLWNDDWSKELTRKNAARRDINLGIGGGTEKSRYYFSLGYLNQDGYVSHSGYERVSTRFNYTNDIKDWLQVGAKVSIITSKQNYPNQGTNDFADVIAYTRTLSSVFPIYQHDDNGLLIKDADGNPVYDYGKPNPSRNVNVNRPVLQPTNEVAT